MLLPSRRNWLRNLFPLRNRSGRRLRKRGTVAPGWAQPAEERIERLEARLLLAAVVTTDHTDYAPGSTVAIAASDNTSPGANFRPGETVQFQVTRTDGGAGTLSGSQPW